MLASRGVVDHHAGTAEELMALSEGKYIAMRDYARFCLQEPKTVSPSE